jgi:3-oxoacyl-[acyl-carrier protein] reductase
MTLENKIVLVTGANRGIGKAIAAKFSAEKCIVFGTATSEDGVAKIDSMFKELGSNTSRGVVLDVTKPESIANLFAVMEDTVGSPDILINNAGITGDNLMLRMKEEDWQRIIDANLTGAFRLMKASIRGMLKKHWGRIISIGSVVGTSGNPGQVNYSASKAGLLGLSKSLAREIGAKGITVNVVSPGFIATDMTDKLSDAQSAKLLTQIPVARMGKPEEIAHAVLFLAQEDSAYITGETIHVNGGMLMQ